MAKRGQGEGSISKRPDGTWWARITLGKDDDGKQKRRAFYGKTRSEVQQKLTAALNDMNNGAYIEPSKVTVGDWTLLWLNEYKKKSLKPKTYSGYRTAYEQHIKPTFGTVKLLELRNEMVQHFINKLNDTGLSTQYIKRSYLVLSAALKQAVKNGMISKNAADGTILPREDKKEMRVLTEEEQDLFVNAAKQITHGGLFIFLLATGARIGEALALTWDDIDFENKCVYIRKTLVDYIDHDAELGSRVKVSVGDTKTAAGKRMIPLLPVIVDMLQKLRQDQDIRKSDIGDAYKNRNCVFCNAMGGFLRSCDMRSKFGKLIAKLKIEDVHIHSLRHTFATDLYAAGVDLKARHSFLGHASNDVTDRYTKMSDEAFKRSLVLINDYYSREPWCEHGCVKALQRWESFTDEERESGGGIFAKYLANELLQELYICVDNLDS